MKLITGRSLDCNFESVLCFQSMRVSSTTSSCDDPHNPFIPSGWGSVRLGVEGRAVAKVVLSLYRLSH